MNKLTDKCGQWILVDSDVDWYLIECSVCKHQMSVYSGSFLPKYCEVCGTKMSEVEK